MDIVQIIATNLGTITGAIFGIAAVSAIILKITSVLNETRQLFAVVIDAMSDNTLTYDEVKVIIKEASDIPTAIKVAMEGAKIVK
jgi:hypothetical protein